MFTGPDRSHSGATRIKVIYRTACGNDTVIDTFAVALNHGVEGVPTTPTLTALLQRVDPIVLQEANNNSLELDT